MINASELRIGNRVYLEQPSFNNITFRNVLTTVNLELLKLISLPQSAMEVKGIPLTPDILESCGFVHNSDRHTLKVFEGYVNISFMFNSFPLVLDIDGSRMPLHEVKFLHQLQNLFFALTGQELEIKELQHA